MFLRKIIFRLRTRVQLRQAARELGIPRDEIDDRMSELGDNDIDAAVEQVGASAKVNKILAIGDGSIIGWIIDFFQSPPGKMLLDFLLGLLFGLALAAVAVEQETTADATPWVIDGAGVGPLVSMPKGKTVTTKSVNKAMMVGTKGLLDYVRLIRSLKDAIKAKDLATIVKLVRDIGKALGFEEESGPLADVILAAAQGEWAKVADALGRFLIAVASNFMPFGTMAVEEKDEKNKVVSEIASVIKTL